MVIEYEWAMWEKNNTYTLMEIYVWLYNTSITQDSKT